MLRPILAAAATLAMTAGVAGAQGFVPGAAAVEGYHERFANDSRPERLPPPSSGLFTFQLPVPGPDLPVVEPETFAGGPDIDEIVVMRPVAAPMPGRVAAEPVRHAGGLTPGAPLGSDDLSDGKRVAGQR